MRVAIVSHVVDRQLAVQAAHHRADRAGERHRLAGGADGEGEFAPRVLIAGIRSTRQPRRCPSTRPRHLEIVHDAYDGQKYRLVGDCDQMLLISIGRYIRLPIGS